MSTLVEQSQMPHKPILPLCVCGDPLCKIPYGYCHCGCGSKTWVSRYTSKPHGYTAGLPVRFVHGHRNLVAPAIEEATPFKIDGVYCRTLPLSGGVFAIVWESDYEWLMKWKWSALKLKNGFYGHRKEKHKTIYLHRFILGITGRKRVDHENGNTLDYRRSNLREATHRQNLLNRPPQANNSTGFKGVSFKKDTGKFRARIHCGAESFYLGSFTTAEEAARAYDRKAIECFGEFAWLNFPAEREA